MDRQQRERALEVADDLRMASVRSPASSYERARRCATTSVSVSLRNWTPSAISPDFSPWKFSMMPLWISASLPSSPPRWGCAFWSVGPPWVAHRVCPMPVLDPGSGSCASADQVGQLPGALGGHAVPGDQGHPGRVVAPVLEPGQALHDDLEGLAVDVRAHVSHDSAHARQPNGRPTPEAAGEVRGGIRNNGARDAPNGHALPSPYVELDRAAWARLRDHHPLSLTQEDVARLRGLGERLDLAEVEQVYLPLSRLLNFYVAATAGLHRVTTDFLGERPSAPRSSSASPDRWRWASPPPPGSCASCWPGGPALLGSSW